jgi:hypothetical protein
MGMTGRVRDRKTFAMADHRYRNASAYAMYGQSLFDARARARIFYDQKSEFAFLRIPLFFPAVGNAPI